MHWLKQSTASQELPLGFFLDSTDGDTEETALTIANTDIKIWKAGATTLANKNSGGATHISNGVYYATLDATDTNTLGPMTVFCHVSGALAVKVDCLVLPANVYDSFVAGSDNLDVNTMQWLGTACATPTTAGVPEVDLTHISGSAVSATTAQLGVNVVNVGNAVENLAREVNHRTTIATLATQTSFTLTAGSADDDAYNGWAIEVIDQSTSTQVAIGIISDYTGSTKTITLDSDPAIFTIATGDTVVLLPGKLTDVVDANVIQWNSSNVATPTNAGVPEVDITHINGAVASPTTAHIGVNVEQINGTTITGDGSPGTEFSV